MKQQVSRRRFLKTGALAALGGWAVPNIIPARVLGRDGSPPPSELPGWALIGCGSISNSAGGGRPLAACDVVRERRLKKKQQWVQGGRYAADSIADYNDFREVLARKDIDVVHCCVNDHWHVPMAILAAEAGKHMHIEKPLGLSLGEEIALGNALQQHNVKFLFGTESRGKPHGRKFVELAANGFVGEIEEMYVIAGQGGGKIEALPEEPVPDGFDWDLWLGPAPQVPHNRKRWNDYRFLLGDYCHGMMHNWGIHPLNIYQWWADLTGLGVPVHYEGEVQFHPHPECRQPVSADTTLRYANGQTLNFLTGDVAKRKNIPCLKEAGGLGNVVVLKGEKGWIKWSYTDISSSIADYPTMMRTTFENPRIIVPQARGGYNGDLFAAIRDNTPTICDWEATFNSDHIILLVILLGQVGTSFRWDPVNRRVLDCAAAAKYLRRPMREPWGSIVYKYLKDA